MKSTVGKTGWRASWVAELEVNDTGGQRVRATSYRDLPLAGSEKLRNPAQNRMVRAFAMMVTWTLGAN
jgi:hypothetical protein